MQFSESSSEARPFVTWQRIADWAQAHYRSRVFDKDERIPTRQGLLYLVNKGVVRLVGKTQLSLCKDSDILNKDASVFGLQDSFISSLSDNCEDNLSQESPTLSESPDELDEAFLGFAHSGQPFEVITQSLFDIQAYSHVEETDIIWLYWSDLENWPHFSTEIYEALRYQHQRKLLWLSALSQRKTIERLMAFITLLVEEYGKPCAEGYCLPYSLTHAQIGSTIGSTRVTVTRLMGKLRRQNAIIIREDNLICLPAKNINSEASS